MSSVKEQGIFAEVEAAYGVAETLVAADAILVQDLTFTPTESLRLIERNVINSSLNIRQALYGGSLLGFQFGVELKGSGSLGVAPQALGDLFRACGLDETIVGATSVTYTPSSDFANFESATIGLRQGGNYRIARGCRGTVSLNYTVGQVVIASFNMIGHIESELEAAAPTPAFEAGNPPAFLDAALTMGAVEFPISALVMDMANNISISPDPNEADGYGQIRVTSRQSGGTIDPEDQDIDTKDFVGELRANTTQAILTGVIGPATFRHALSIPLAYFKNVQFGDREELIVANVEYGAADTDGTDDFSLQLT